MGSAGFMFFGVFGIVGSAAAAEYFVAPDGSDAAAGTMAAPFATMQKGHDAASAGDTVWLRAGTYKVGKQIKLSKSGQSDAMRIKFFAYAKELPVIDFGTYAPSNTAADVPALLLTGSWLHLRGLEIKNVPIGRSGAHSISAVRSEGASNNTYELLNIHHNFGPGLFISKGTGGNLILNCDSHDNYDKDGSQGDGQNGDGFGVHYQESGPSTILRGNRAWLNSDDGYDLISQEVPVMIDNCWAAQNGYSDGGAGKPSSGNGNGFKAGSSQTGIRHTIQNSIAWKNRAAGFYANHSSGGNTWLNNTSYNNAVAYNMLASSPGDSNSTITLSGAKAHKMRNNIAFPYKNSNMNGVDSMFNTWDLSITESGDFVSTSDEGANGPRQADGSLPDLAFMKLKSGSKLIDKGTNVMLPFVGTAPDLGAREFGAVSTGSGGTPPGTGGTPGAGGMPPLGAGGTETGTGGTPGAAGSPGTGGTGAIAGSSSVGGAGLSGSGGGSGSGAAGTSTGAVSSGSGGATTGSGAAPTTGGATGSGAAPTGGGDDDDASSGCAVAPGGSASQTALASLLSFSALAFLFARRRRNG